MKRVLLLALACGVALTPMPSTALGPSVVIDPALIAEAVKNGAVQVKQLVQQAQQLVNEATMIKNQLDAYKQAAQNFVRLPASLVSQVQNAMRDYRNILANTRGISYTIDAAIRQAEQLYGSAMGDIEKMKTYAGQHSQQLLQASQTAMANQAIVDKIQQQQALVGQALSMSDTATGNLDVSQATNQLIAIQIQQQAMLIQLQAANERAAASYYAQIAASQQAAAERAQQWLQRDPSVIPFYKPPGQTSGGVDLPLMH